MNSSYFFDYYFKEEQISNFIQEIIGLLLLLTALFFTIIMRYRSFVGISIPLFLASFYLIISSSYSLYRLPEQRKNLIEMVEQKSKQIQQKQITKIASKNQQLLIFQIAIAGILLISIFTLILTYKQIFWKNIFASLTVLCILLLCIKHIDDERGENFLILIDDYDVINNIVK